MIKIGDLEINKNTYNEYCERHFGILRPWLDKKILRILDIGAGYGGIDVLILKHLGISVELNVIEGQEGDDENSFVTYGEGLMPWWDGNKTREIIKMNVLNKCNIFPPDPRLIIPVDMVISLKSWGHHYPVGRYIKLVLKSLEKGGRVILDIRKRHIDDELGVFERYGFKYVDQIDETPKCKRFVLEKI